MRIKSNSKKQSDSSFKSVDEFDSATEDSLAQIVGDGSSSNPTRKVSNSISPSSLETFLRNTLCDSSGRVTKEGASLLALKLSKRRIFTRHVQKDKVKELVGKEFNEISQEDIGQMLSNTRGRMMSVYGNGPVVATKFKRGSARRFTEHFLKSAVTSCFHKHGPASRRGPASRLRQVPYTLEKEVLDKMEGDNLSTKQRELITNLTKGYLERFKKAGGRVVTMPEVVLLHWVYDCISKLKDDSKEFASLVEFSSKIQDANHAQGIASLFRGLQKGYSECLSDSRIGSVTWQMTAESLLSGIISSAGATASASEKEELCEVIECIKGLSVAGKESLKKQVCAIPLPNKSNSTSVDIIKSLCKTLTILNNENPDEIRSRYIELDGNTAECQLLQKLDRNNESLNAFCGAFNAKRVRKTLDRKVGHWKARKFTRKLYNITLANTKAGFITRSAVRAVALVGSGLATVLSEFFPAAVGLAARGTGALQMATTAPFIAIWTGSFAAAMGGVLSPVISKVSERLSYVGSSPKNPRDITPLDNNRTITVAEKEEEVTAVGSYFSPRAIFELAEDTLKQQLEGIFKDEAESNRAQLDAVKDSCVQEFKNRLSSGSKHGDYSVTVAGKTVELKESITALLTGIEEQMKEGWDKFDGDYKRVKETLHNDRAREDWKRIKSLQYKEFTVADENYSNYIRSFLTSKGKRIDDISDAFPL